MEDLGIFWHLTSKDALNLCCSCYWLRDRLWNGSVLVPWNYTNYYCWGKKFSLSILAVSGWSKQFLNWLTSQFNRKIKFLFCVFGKPKVIPGLGEAEQSRQHTFLEFIYIYTYIFIFVKENGQAGRAWGNKSVESKICLYGLCWDTGFSASVSRMPSTLLMGRGAFPVGDLLLAFRETKNSQCVLPMRLLLQVLIKNKQYTTWCIGGSLP